MTLDEDLAELAGILEEKGRREFDKVELVADDFKNAKYESRGLAYQQAARSIRALLWLHSDGR